MSDDKAFGEVDAIARARHEVREQRLTELKSERDRLLALGVQDVRLAEITAEIETLARETKLAPVILSGGWVATTTKWPGDDGEPEVVRVS